jgi:hypothetical protein
MRPGLPKGRCPGCQTELEIAGDYSHPVISCPNCARQVAVGAAVAFRRASRRRNLMVWATVFGLLAIAIGFIGYRFRGHLSSGFGFLAEATGNKTIAVLSLVLAVLILLCIFAWMVFPILVYLGLKDLRHRTARLDQTAQRSMQYLAQLTAHQNTVKPDPTPEQRTDGAVPR